jgi:phenylacetate-coenzyme A ligase PaaK-like adenylate-forming protein
MISEPDVTVNDAIPEAIKAFCSIEEAYPPDEKHNALFVDAMREVTAWHIKNSPWYQKFAEINKVIPDNIQTLNDVLALPPVHANFFKFHEIRSITLDQVTVHLTSSGTTGQKSQIFFDDFTITHAREMVDRVMQFRGGVSDISANYLVNAYEPYEGFKVGTSNTNQYLMRYAPVADQFWTLRYIGKQKHEFDAFGAIASLEQWAQSDRPVRIIGFPAFLHFILERMRNTGRPSLRLPEGSCVILGGGWKGHADKAIPKSGLCAAVEEQFGIPSARVIETYGSVEHSIPYLDCEKHHLHQPAWSRVLVRDVKTLEPVKDGTPGFLSFISPYITSAPAHSIVMGDLAVRHAPGSCDCHGHPTAWFEVLGRAGTSSNKSCAAAASEFLKG